MIRRIQPGSSSCTASFRRPQGGLSLIELMVSMAASLIVLLAIGQMYMGSKASYRITEGLISLQESGRYGLASVGHAVMMADHWGGVDVTEVSGNPTVTGVSGSSDCDSAWVVDLSNPIFGMDGDAVISGVTGFSDCVQGGEYVPGSDVLVVRYADSQPVDNSVVSSTASPNSSNDLFIRTATGERGTLFLGGSDPVSATGIADQDGTDNYRYRVEAFFLRPCSVLDASSNCTDGIPTLTRLTYGDGGNVEQQALVDGVEQIQFQYGIDDTGTGRVSRFVSASTVPNWNQVLAVRIDMLVRTLNPDVGFSDPNSTYTLAGGTADSGLVYTVPSGGNQYHRKQMSKVIQIRNRTRF